MKTATCRPPHQVICSAPLGGITPKVATQGWKKIPLVSGQVQGHWPQSARDHRSAPKGGHPATLLPSWASRQHNRAEFGHLALEGVPRECGRAF